MEEFNEKVAVMTDAASGIGSPINRHCINEGMGNILADIEIERPLEVERHIGIDKKRIVNTASVCGLYAFPCFLIRG